jgi:hypothetical protein
LRLVGLLGRLRDRLEEPLPVEARVVGFEPVHHVPLFGADFQSVSTARPWVALILGLIAAPVFGWMVIGPFFENPVEYLLSPRLGYAFFLTPCVFVLALSSFLLADGTDATSKRATAVVVAVAAAVLLYWLVPCSLPSA